jgi:anti-anti-sigma regulatory factor
MHGARKHEMVIDQSIQIAAGKRLSHDEACRLSKLAIASPAQSIVLDMTQCDDASTAAFARLILLRRDLLKTGRDVQIIGLKARAGRLFEVHRLEAVLPQVSELPAAVKKRTQPRPFTCNPASGFELDLACA